MCTHDVCLLLCSLYDAYSDEMGVVDFSRSQNGSGMASQSQVSIIIKHILDLHGYRYNCSAKHVHMRVRTNVHTNILCTNMWLLQVKWFVAELNKIAETTFNCLFTTQQMKDISKVVNLAWCMMQFINYPNHSKCVCVLIIVSNLVLCMCVYGQLCTLLVHTVLCTLFFSCEQLL